jgi:hypothetical protein
VIFLYSILYLWLFWGVYVIVMGVYRAHLSGRLSKVGLALGSPYVIAGYAMDILANIIIATIVFLEPPCEWLVTTRLKRYMAGDGWRKRSAEWICTHLLDVFDPSGDHC